MRTTERSVHGCRRLKARNSEGAGATAGRTFPASWTAAQNRQYSTAAGVDGFDWAESSAEPRSTVPMAGWEAGQQAACPQWT